MPIHFLLGSLPNPIIVPCRSLGPVGWMLRAADRCVINVLDWRSANLQSKPRHLAGGNGEL